MPNDVCDNNPVFEEKEKWLLKINSSQPIESLYLVQAETHKGLKRVTLICLLLSDAPDYSFSKVPYLEREEEITDQSNFVNNVT